jgi:hypothetical protein
VNFELHPRHSRACSELRHWKHHKTVSQTMCNQVSFANCLVDIFIFLLGLFNDSLHGTEWQVEYEWLRTIWPWPIGRHLRGRTKKLRTIFSHDCQFLCRPRLEPLSLAVPFLRRGSPVSTMTGYGLDYRVRFQDGARISLPPLCPDRLWGSWSVVTTGYQRLSTAVKQL